MMQKKVIDLERKTIELCAAGRIQEDLVKLITDFMSDIPPDNEFGISERRDVDPLEPRSYTADEVLRFFDETIHKLYNQGYKRKLPQDRFPAKWIIKGEEYHFVAFYRSYESPTLVVAGSYSSISELLDNLNMFKDMLNMNPISRWLRYREANVIALGVAALSSVALYELGYLLGQGAHDCCNPVVAWMNALFQVSGYYLWKHRSDENIISKLSQNASTYHIGIVNLSNP
jgi:hypothetical protein